MVSLYTTTLSYIAFTYFAYQSHSLNLYSQLHRNSYRNWFGPDMFPHSGKPCRNNHQYLQSMIGYCQSWYMIFFQLSCLCAKIVPIIEFIRDERLNTIVVLLVFWSFSISIILHLSFYNSKGYRTCSFYSSFYRHTNCKGKWKWRLLHHTLPFRK